eukprot:CAMPEP_0113713582 /NCGR_PEP_ID=MMETSP0038_2-20120614/32084_1 /TAXON_ID=2898 /ORGANISM="Cryptomonas paramecium" /LENGTH=72 /DNA_ID=CAMNT_0000640349 /DNA_START=21 /DNA_END=235 /DNA_ORIENTATION=- /assembly_acc=CAM_ASM_000170
MEVDLKQAVEARAKEVMRVARLEAETGALLEELEKERGFARSLQLEREKLLATLAATPAFGDDDGTLSECPG